MSATDPEIIRLRDWRHDVAAPQLEALRLKLDLAMERLDRLEPAVERLARADEIAAAVTESIKSHRRGLLTTGEKIAAFAVAGAAIANVVVSFVH